MKKSALLIGLFILFAGFVSLNSRAQEAPAMPENFLVIEEFVTPSDMAAFIEAQQKAVDLWKKHDFGISLYTYRTAEDSYYWVVPIANFGGIDDVFQKANAVVAKMEEDGYDADKEFKDLSTTRQSVLHWMKDLSYHPNGNMGQTADKPYCEWTFVSLRAGHEKAAAGVVQKYIDFYKSVDENYEWDIYAVSLGYDTPMWILMNRDESELAMREHEAELSEKYADTFRKLWMEFSTHVRKYENQKGWYLPKWSLNVPE